MTRRQRRAQFDALQARVERLVKELSFAWHHVAQRQLAFEKLRAECDEARELVRRYVEAELDPTDADGDGGRAAFNAIISAVDRWDEEAKR